MAASRTGRGPEQKPSRVSRAPGMPPVRAPGRQPAATMNAAADRQEQIRAKPGPTRVGDNTPVPSRGRRSTAPDVPPGVRDLSARVTGASIFQRANRRANNPGPDGQ